MNVAELHKIKELERKNKLLERIVGLVEDVVTDDCERNYGLRDEGIGRLRKAVDDIDWPILTSPILVYIEGLEQDKARLDWLEKMGRWADVDQFLVALEESWHNADLRQAIDKAREE